MSRIAFNIIVSILAFTFGLAYIILSLIPSLPPPNGFLVHWQNHKDFWAEGLDLTVPSPIPPTIESSNHLAIPLPSHFMHPSAWHPASSKITAPTTTSSTPVSWRNNSNNNSNFGIY
ncbi:hypothetical protein G6F46_010561 [Rhizopus delemar]|uniref:Uncharacterized protein n=1 Tax=Rhizopus oryzae TaxID=64495 RepID=A0A9P7CA12_RHIOR|nr:hypothetical protein G6F55_008130 [Rhizopus delemar]KAG1543515.1 hypothetical protein G6F51_006624 [Rhizopus arrhizus]KAG1497295.1 hypothetical protein G6F54_005867 [Rhizopus delemar]KAG1509613.1 hypothetical protein G6F53_007308 [Rhizopus delemar]KAG1520380.1 hypothetical protein G6F52_007721 [Rhizopus delemar]